MHTKQGNINLKDLEIRHIKNHTIRKAQDIDFCTSINVITFNILEDETKVLIRIIYKSLAYL
jgi:hypothetical protein